jgi:hypothetical protein
MLSSSSRKSLDYLKSELRAEVYMKGIDDQPTWTPIFVPNLVHQLLDKKIQYAFQKRKTGHEVQANDSQYRSNQQHTRVQERSRV